MEIDCLQRNGTFKSQLTNRHNARPRLNYYFLSDPSHFSLPSTFKITVTRKNVKGRGLPGEIKVDPHLKAEVCKGVVENVHGAVLPPHLQLPSPSLHF